ncbi:MAG: hypothetical protein A2Z16_03110 [Chloroflexi bacterium RBG_16_54_18]|nr:MAG: hypothetical protein A2Z16_03110 [Chloroflexi bacterium RBG_16_54_18]
MKHALTIDLEDWYHGLTSTNKRPETWASLSSRTEQAVELLLDLLAANKLHGTFFVLGDLAQKCPSVIRQIAAAGHDLGSHGFSHRPVHLLKPTEFKSELDRTTQIIQDISGLAVTGFRAPYFSIDQRCLWAFEVLAESGYQYDSSVFPLRTILYGYPGASRHPFRPLPGAELVEYPVATIKVAGLTLPAAGGFYFRIYPYGFIRWSLRSLEKQGQSGVLYMHPWEFDLQQPRIPVTFRERITHFAGRSSWPEKLKRLSRDFELVPLGELHRLWLQRN